MIALDVLFAIGTLLLVQINGGGHSVVLGWFFAATAANVVLLMVLLMILTVYLNNIVAAVIVFVFNSLIGIIAALHTLVQNGVIKSQIWDGVINTLYWAFPHQLLSNLQREIVQASLRLNPPPPAASGRAAFNALSGVPSASGAGDIVFWFVYLGVLVVILLLAVRRKQV